MRTSLLVFSLSFVKENAMKGMYGMTSLRDIIVGSLFKNGISMIKEAVINCCCIQKIKIKNTNTNTNIKVRSLSN